MTVKEPILVEPKEVMEKREKRVTRSQELFRRLKQNKTAIVGLFIMIFLVFFGVFADFIAPQDPLAQKLPDRLKPGSRQS